MSTLEEIESQIEALRKQADEIRKNEKREIIAGIKQQIAQYGLTARELGLESAGGAPRARVREVMPPKYRGPNGETWHGGRGAKPKWVREIVDNGGNIEDYLIQ